MKGGITKKKKGAADLCAGHVVVRRSQPHCGDAPSSRRVAGPNLWPRHLLLFMRCLPNLPPGFCAMLDAPFAQFAQHGPQGPAVGGQRVFHFRGKLVVNFSFHRAGALQIPQLLREHFARNAGNEALQFEEPARVPPQMPKDEGLPFPAEDFQRDFDRTMISRGTVGLHIQVTKKCLIARSLLRSQNCVKHTVGDALYEWKKPDR